MTLYRWRGVDPRGLNRGGRSDWPGLAAEVEARFKAGWRSLAVCSGEGPVPPTAADAALLVAEICPHPATGKRTWWAEAEPGRPVIKEA